MAWYDRLLRRTPFVEDWSALKPGRVELEGVVEVIERLADPVGGEACVAIEYRAWPPSTTLGVDGGTTVGGRAFQLEARQAVEFLLRNGDRQILVRPDAGEDVGAMHRELLGRYGVNLRAHVLVVAPGATVRVAGTLQEITARASPMRADPYFATMAAERFWIV